MSDEPKMTEEEAELLLKKLKEHYGQPVMPMSRFCEGIRTWFSAIEANNTKPELRVDYSDDPDWGWKPEDQHGHSYYNVLQKVHMDIMKSALLARILYANEPFRTEMCPVHKGHWEGQAQLLHGCTYGCDGSGWLKTPELAQKRLERFRIHGKMTDAEVIALAESGGLPKKDLTDPYEFYSKRYLFEWLYLLGRIDLVPEDDRT